jgi:glycosyltransferase 2 family protein
MTIKLTGAWRTLFALVLTVAVLAALFAVLDVSTLVAALREIDLRFFGLALAAMPLFIALKAYKWHCLARTCASVTYFDSLGSYLVGNSLSLFTPSKTGELARALYLPSGSKEAILGLTVVDKVFDLLGLLSLTSLGLLLVSGPLAALPFAIAAAALIAMLLNLRFLGRFVAGHPWLSRVKPLVSLCNGVAVNTRIVGISLGLTLITFFVVLAQCYCLVLAFGPVSPIAILFTFPLAMLTNILPLTISGLGIREGTAVLLLGTFGVPGAAAFNAAFLLFFINTFVPGPAGALVMLGKHAKPGANAISGGRH